MALSKIQTKENQVIPNLGRRNLMFNGAMQIAQRGTSFSYSAGQSADLLDRWQVAVGSSYNFDTTISQSTTTPSGEGFKYSLKVEMDAAITPSGSENGGIFMKFEGQDFQRLAYGTPSAKSITLSFWVRSNKTGTYCCQIQTNQHDSTNSNKYFHIKEYTISAANTWEKKTLTFTGLTAQTITQTIGDGFRMIWWLSVGPDDKVATADTWTQSAGFLSTANQVNFADSANNEWYLTGCQLEIGDQATDFEYLSFGEDLALCQRYFCGFTPDTSTGVTHAGLMNLNVRSTTSRYSVIHFPVPMRIRPTLSYSGSLNGYSGNGTYAVQALSMNGSTGHSAEIESTFNTSGTVGHGGWVRILAGAYVHFDAEL